MFRPMKFQEKAICKLQLNYEEIYVEFSIHSKGVCLIDNIFSHNNKCILLTAHSAKHFHQIYLMVSCLFYSFQYFYNKNKLYYYRN